MLFPKEPWRSLFKNLIVNIINKHFEIIKLMSNTIIIKPCKLLPKTNYKYSLTKEYIIFLLTIKTHEE